MTTVTTSDVTQDSTKASLTKLTYIEVILNDHPREILGFGIPREVYTELVERHCLKRLVPPDSGFALQG